MASALTCTHLPQKHNASNGRGDNILYYDVIFMTNIHRTFMLIMSIHLENKL